MKQPKQVKPAQHYTPPLHALQAGKPASRHAQKPPRYGPPLAKAIGAAQPKHYTPHLGAAVRAQAAAKARAKNAKVRKPKRRGLALAGDVACCAAQALAESLMLAGGSVEPSDVLVLYRHTADDPDAGASIVETLNAAAEHGLAGVRPVSFEPVSLDIVSEYPVGGHTDLILGVDLPGPHVVVPVWDWWMSWAGAWPRYLFPDAVIEEAWQVTWPCPQ